MGRKFDYLGDVEVFIAVVEHGSFTAGAVALSTTPSVLSRAISRLEARLGRQLLQRTTRRVGLTEAGRLYLEQVRSAFSLLVDAERDVQGQEGELAGRVRLSVPTTYGHYRLPPLLARFARQYPRVQVELNITNRNVDLVAEGFDLAIRLGHLPDSGLVARKLEDATLLLVASPEYLRRMGAPQTLEDLQRHMCLPFVMPRTGRIAPGCFAMANETSTGCPVHPSKPQMTCSGWYHSPNTVLASARVTSSSSVTGCSAVNWWKCCRSFADDRDRSP